MWPVFLYIFYWDVQKISTSWIGSPFNYNASLKNFWQFPASICSFSKMSAAYVSRYEAIFLCTHSKGPKMTWNQAAVYEREKRFEDISGYNQKALNEIGFKISQYGEEATPYWKTFEKRLSCARENKNRNCNKKKSIQASFWPANYSSRAWSTADNSVLMRTVKHPEKVHV